MGFAEKLVAYRKEVNMTQEMLADICNVTRQAVAKWEKGDSLPDVYLIARIASIFKVSIEELIWSRDITNIENKKFYIRESEETDKKDFCLIMREHRFLGRLLQLIDKDMQYSNVDDEYWKDYREAGKIFVLRSKIDDTFGGYVYVESIETNSPQLTMQFSEKA